MTPEKTLIVLNMWYYDILELADSAIDTFGIDVKELANKFDNVESLKTWHKIFCSLNLLERMLVMAALGAGQTLREIELTLVKIRRNRTFGDIV